MPVVTAPSPVSLVRGQGEGYDMQVSTSWDRIALSRLLGWLEGTNRTEGRTRYGGYTTDHDADDNPVSGCIGG